ncbi:MAG: lipopolysaccharide assembly protein LapA domain-containing protein [Gemmatimonadota bacterium]
MKTGSRVLSFLLVTGLAFWFTVANAGLRVRVDLLLFRLSLSVPLLVFGAMLIGMLTVLLVGLKEDLRTRRVLERYREVIQSDD